MSLILGADLSLNSSGLCVIGLEKGNPLHYEAVTSDLDYIERLGYNYQRYLNILKSFSTVEIIAYESQNKNMRFNYTAGSILPLAENVGIWKKALYDSLPYFKSRPIILAIPAEDIKEYATGNKKADKDAMIEAVNGNHIKGIRNSVPEHSVNDLADAYHLARMVRSLYREDQQRFLSYVEKDYGDHIINNETIRMS